ncbi:hypothetical protein [Simplicispira psychrophila]|uniref:TubC N-terminal docking domain-related protein n=1 Tax=Simplicispira psychrophila TaxID=80882 RepID=UPI000487A130|nr:hypothetical protein [Simplicispira psychrophila]
MIAFDLYKDLHRAGVVLSVDGDGLVVGRADRLTDAMRADIRQHKAALIQLLLDSSRTTHRLLAAAMRRCDHFNDGEVAREQMRLDVLATPLHLRQDLLDYFNEINQKDRP